MERTIGFSIKQWATVHPHHQWPYYTGPVKRGQGISWYECIYIYDPDNCCKTLKIPFPRQYLCLGVTPYPFPFLLSDLLPSSSPHGSFNKLCPPCCTLLTICLPFSLLFPISVIWSIHHSGFLPHHPTLPYPWTQVSVMQSPTLLTSGATV